MSRFWLVQRVLFEDYERARFWSDHPSRFSLAYMGSAEFEFGATAQSLKRLVPIADQLVFERTTIRGFSFDIIRKPTDLEGTANLAVWLETTMSPERRGQTTKEYPHGLLARLGGRLDPNPPPGRGGKEHQRKVYSWRSGWAESGVLHWDLDADFFFALTPGQGPDSQPEGGIAAAFLAEMRAVAAARRDA